MNIELDEGVVMDVSDDALEQAACGAQAAASVMGGICLTLQRPICLN